MIAGPAAYTGRRRAVGHVQPRTAFAAVLIVVAAMVLALKALPDRHTGQPDFLSANGPVGPEQSVAAPTDPATNTPRTTPAPSGSPSARPSATRSSPSAGAASSPARSGAPTTGTASTPAAVVVSIEAEAPGNGRPSGMSVREAVGASGGRAVTGVGNGHALEFAGVEVARRGDYGVTIAYLSTEPRQCYVGVGWNWLSVTFPSSGGAVASVTVTLALPAGRNTVEAGNTPGRWCPDLDRISVTPG